MRFNVVSSYLANVHYDEISRVLMVGFKNGKEYSYRDVPKDTADAFAATQHTSSKITAGQFFTQSVKDRFHTID